MGAPRGWCCARTRTVAAWVASTCIAACRFAQSPPPMPGTVASAAKRWRQLRSGGRNVGSASGESSRWQASHRDIGSLRSALQRQAAVVAGRWRLPRRCSRAPCRPAALALAPRLRLPHAPRLRAQQQPTGQRPAVKNSPGQPLSRLPLPPGHGWLRPAPTPLQRCATRWSRKASAA